MSYNSNCKWFSMEYVGNPGAVPACNQKPEPVSKAEEFGKSEHRNFCPNCGADMRGETDV